MSQTSVEQSIVKALEENRFCAFGTVENNKPKVRYMAVYNEGLNIHLATDRKTQKVDELEQNPNCYLLLGYEKGGNNEVIEIEATCAVSTNDELKQRVWKDEFKNWFSGPDDPDYVVLDITPQTIEYTDKEGQKQTWNG
ncbi:pyridoxamine 5'-phosphate oxidase family protein [Paenibacillus bovis]|uniref:General stress protein n=1 Tax=Paenibacillus bovis TaxID=1616788 RepID=A0A172ZCI7_9BACL|nr:pyridoxamine 5'-phosphate oxidase family protein [Paenibacillus bovis]ANF95371.1 general stress protein [Paenibacillus bovis]